MDEYKEKAKGRGSCKSVRGLSEIREKICDVVFGWQFALFFGVSAGVVRVVWDKRKNSVFSVLCESISWMRD